VTLHGPEPPPVYRVFGLPPVRYGEGTIKSEGGWCDRVARTEINDLNSDQAIALRYTSSNRAYLYGARYDTAAG
jgi:hypothetical protein